MLCHASSPTRRKVERRRQERRLVAARGLFELDRLGRLQRLSTSLRECSSELGQVQQDLASLKLNAEVSKPPAPPLLLTWHKTDGFSGTYGRPLEDQQPRSQAGISTPSSNRGELELKGAKQGWDLRCLSITETHNPCSGSLTDISDETQVTLPDSHAERPDGQTSSLPTRLSRMLVQYLESIPTLSSLTQPSADVKPEVPPTVQQIQESPKVEATVILPTAVPEEDIEAAKEEYALSKNQQSLTDEEGKLWDMIAESATVDSVPESITKYAQDLEAKSAVLSESFQRRQYPPTQSTYAESREILHAMGIPCIEPVGAFEGEALAASLVLNGHADYVVSEDTVSPLDGSSQPATTDTLVNAGRDRIRRPTDPQHHQQRRASLPHRGQRRPHGARAGRRCLRRLRALGRHRLLHAHQEPWSCARAQVDQRARHDRACPRARDPVSPDGTTRVLPGDDRAGSVGVPDAAAHIRGHARLRRR